MLAPIPLAGDESVDDAGDVHREDPVEAQRLPVIACRLFRAQTGRVRQVVGGTIVVQRCRDDDHEAVLDGHCEVVEPMTRGVSRLSHSRLKVVLEVNNHDHEAFQ